MNKQPILTPVDPILLDPSGSVMIPECDGTLTFAPHFKSSDSLFDTAVRKVKQVHTNAVELNLHTLLRPSTPECAFRAIPGSWESILLTQHQIVKFYLRYQKHLDGADYNMAFLTGVGSQLVVVVMDVYSPKEISLYTLGHVAHWNTKSSLCLVTPKSK